jgi:hypothetical protein
MLFDVSQLLSHSMLCIDMKSFYASCECVDYGLDPLNDCVVVVVDKKQSGSVVLAASPKMKSEYGIKTGSRLYQVPSNRRIHIFNAWDASLPEKSCFTRLFHGRKGRVLNPMGCLVTARNLSKSSAERNLCGAFLFYFIRQYTWIDKWFQTNQKSSRGLNVCHYVSNFVEELLFKMEIDSINMIDKD